ncbi:mini-chromosome maintenance replisome factor-domain-containing protein [Amylocystis lapponica]|nr:mini-chromosome maintenance replisome factor-domain-containing protein [Amylocystis lapponica]
MGLVYRVDALRYPTAALQELYSESDGANADNFPRLVSDHFERVFRTSDAFKEIPTLDVLHPPDTFPDRALVRFRAMVQDTSPSAEIYLSESSAGGLGGWGLSPVTTEGSDDIKYSETTVLWAVNVPGESAWSAEELDGTESHQERQASASSTQALVHKYPFPSLPHIGVQVKLYDRDDLDRFKATDIVTFVGILSTDPLSTTLDSPVDVPTLHVLFSRTHSHGLLCRRYPRPEAPLSTDGTSATYQTPARTRENLIAWIADEALGGDREAADWVLLTCIARVQSRNPPLLPPSLTLAHFPPPPAVPSTGTPLDAPVPTLSAILSLLLPLAHTLPLSLSMLNSSAFMPESKEEDLHSGRLQLPRGTVLLVTEGGVQEGKLIDRGVRNVQALQEVLSAQTLAYVFPFSQFTFHTDISCVVLSEGSKSVFFKTDLSVPLKYAASPAAVSSLYKPVEDIVLPPPAQLEAFRDLVVGARAGKVGVCEETSEYIQRDFVRERQRDKTVTSEDLIRRMTVAKLYALSKHETNLSVDMWERAKSFDERRRARLV